MAKCTTIRNEIKARLNNGATIEDAVYGAIRQCGPVIAVRVSSAQAKGAAKKYPYWGVVLYEVRIARRGHLTSVALERADSKYRSTKKAERLCSERAEERDAIHGVNIGKIDPAWLARAVGVC